MGSIAMKTADHLLLGQYLVERCGTPHLRCHRRAFLLGCVEPDYNVFSYLRGMRYYEKFRGHNAENSSAFLSHCFTDFEGHTLHSAWDYFRLGTMIHYAADAFTAPHNNFWTGTLSEHCAYKRRCTRNSKGCWQLHIRNKFRIGNTRCCTDRIAGKRTAWRPIFSTF